MSRKAFLEPLREDVRLRTIIVTGRGRVEDFVVQLEVVYKGKWRPCLRYNYAHGKPHRDLIYKEGRTTKEWLATENLGALISFARKDLKENFQTHVRRMGYEEA